MKVPLSSCRYKLASLWMGGFFILAVVLVVQQVLGHYGNDADAAWTWLLPNVVPTLSLMVGVLVAAQRSKHPERESVDRNFYRLSLSVSLAYLGFLLLTILIQPFASQAPLTLMESSKNLLTPFQGLATGMLGAFFVSGTDDSGSPTG